LSRQRTSIATQVAVIACAVFFVGITAFSFLSYYRAAGSFDRVWREDLQARVVLLTGQLAIMDATARSGADRLSGVFSGMLPGPIRVDESRPVQIGDRSVPSVYAGGQILNLDFSVVDSFSRLTNGAATIFVRTGDDFMRVTTSLRKEDGSRAMGTMLGKAHPAYEPLMKGQPYLGRADLFGHVYMSRYSPVVDSRGVTVAILYVGFDITETVAQLVKQIDETRIGEGGLFFVIDDSQGEGRGKLIVHRDDKGRNVLQDGAGLEGYRAALDAGEGTVVAGDRMYVVTRFAPWQRVVGASISVDELRAEAVALRNVLLLLGVAVLVVGCIATYMVLRRKLSPLERLAADAGRLGSGDLTVRVPVTSRDEVGELAAAFNGMADQIAGIIARLKQATGSVKEAVRAVQDESAQVRHGSQEQSDAASRVAAALEEVTVSLDCVAANARDSQGLSKRTDDLSAHGEAVAARAAEETMAIATAVRDTAQSIGMLSRRSEEISQVVKVIKDIADQTNLLALNAAIEAARAGEQGRGFAVVADEVRKLAERTSQATLEIAEMINAIQKETDGAVTGMRSGSERVEEGVRLVREAVNALSEIRGAAGESLDKAGEISRAMDEQSAAGIEISRNVERIATMADENNAAAERNNATVARLEALAAELSALTEGLRVADGGR